MNTLIDDIGTHLVRDSKTANFSAQYGLLGRLYPYILVASERMSLRAIERWLKETYDVSITAVSLSRAMRNPEKYWSDFFSPVEGAFVIIREVVDIPPTVFFSHPDILDSGDLDLGGSGKLSFNLPVQKENEELFEEAKSSYEDALKAVRHFVSGLPNEVRQKCAWYLDSHYSAVKHKEDEDGE